MSVHNLSHDHFTREARSTLLRQQMVQQGFAILHETQGTHPGWAYTVGLFRAATINEEPAPELLISGLSMVQHTQWLLTLGSEILGRSQPEISSSEATSLLEPMGAQALLSLSDGRRFATGVIYRNLAGSRLAVCFGEVEPRYYAPYAPQAYIYHQHRMFPLLQLVWADKRGYFPWEPRYFDPKLQGLQRLLFDPARYLPLREASEG